MGDFRTYLLILGEARGLAYVLSKQQMAFTGIRARGGMLRQDDQLLLYTSRGAFGNPGRDRGRIIGKAEARSDVRSLDKPIEIGGRRFNSVCDLAVTDLTPFGQGLELAPLVEQLEVFPVPRTWSAFLRRPLLLLPETDVRRIERLLRPLLSDPKENLAGYLNAARVNR